MKTKTISTFIHLSDWEPCKDIVLPKGKWTILLDYPLDDTYKIPFTAKKPLGTVGVINAVVRVYGKVYGNEDKYGVWGHGMEDLTLEEIKVNYKRREISCLVGS